MTILSPMSAQTYSQYLEESFACYASDLVIGKVATADSVLEKLRSDVMRSLPRGLATPDNFLFEVRDEKTGLLAGYFWYMIQTRLGERLAFVCDILIKPEFQRQGRATQVLTVFEEEMKTLGIFCTGLHVFGHNQKARALYEKLGYAPTSIQMRKSLVES